METLTDNRYIGADDVRSLPSCSVCRLVGRRCADPFGLVHDFRTRVELPHGSTSPEGERHAGAGQASSIERSCTHRWSGPLFISESTGRRLSTARGSGWVYGAAVWDKSPRAGRYVRDSR